MLGDSNIVAIVPTHDLGTSRPFYEDTLGLKVIQEDEGRAVGFETGQGTKLLLYVTQVNIPAEHTAASFTVDDIESTVAGLESRGVEFEVYDLSEYGFDDLEQSKIIAMPDGSKSAFFTDPEGNILAVGEGHWD